MIEIKIDGRVLGRDWLEQVARSKDWDYRREAYRTMAGQIGGIAQESYDRVCALESAG